MTAYILLNHKLTQKQRDELHKKYCCDKIEFLPETLRGLWEQISPKQEITCDFLKPIILWLKGAAPQNIVVVSGDFGAVFALVDWCLNNELVPVYAATKRVSNEIRDGELVKKINIFEHICFKKYTRLEMK